MRRNKLYTINKGNKHLFVDGGLASYGYAYSTPDKIQLSQNTLSAAQDVAYNNYLASSGNNWLGLSKKDNPFSKENVGTTMKGIGGAAAAIGSQVNTGDPRGLYDTLDPVYHLAGGRESGVGNALSDTGVGLFNAGAQSGNGWLMLAGAGAKILGGLTNSAFGVKTDKERVNAINNGVNDLYGYTSNANTFDSIQAPTSIVSSEGVYKGGWFSGGKARRKQQELSERRQNAIEYADRAVRDNIDRLASDQMNLALANYAAYGGPLGFGSGALGIMQNDKYIDAINNRSNAIAKTNSVVQPSFGFSSKTFADGGGIHIKPSHRGRLTELKERTGKTEEELYNDGNPAHKKMVVFARSARKWKHPDGGSLQAAFLDNFGSDPIGAAIRYNQGLEQMAAQKEAEEAAAAREAEYTAMQQRLANLETQNQGLQALMEAMPKSYPMPEATTVEAESTAPEPVYTPSTATPLSRNAAANWKYIEGQLRKSGRFNDTQIEGIKYNLQRESAIGTVDGGDNGTARGLAQWRGSRIPKDMSLEGQTRHLIETLGNYDGKEHWIGRGNYEGFLNARTPEEAHYYIAKGYERPAASILAKVKNVSDMSLRKRAFGGELGTNGTDWTNGLLYVDEGGSHESNPLEGVPMGVDAEGVPNLVEENETVYNNYVFSNRMKVPDFMGKELGLGNISKKGITFADASKKLAKESEQRPNDPISQAGLEASLSKLAEVQETERAKKDAEESLGLEYACGGRMKKYAGGGVKPGMSSYNRFGKEVTFDNLGDDDSKYPNITFELPKGWWRMSDFSLPKEEEKPIGGERTGERLFETDQYGNPIENTAPDNENEEGYGLEYNPYPTWMRYAPVIGGGLGVLTDALGLTNKPDYTYADKIEAAAQRAGYVPNVRFSPIGDYMKYNPLDRMFYANQLMANARATDRALMNSSSPSRAVGLLASGYNTTNSIGNMIRQAENENRAQYERTKEFNRRTNMFNSQMGLEADTSNARYRQMAAQMGLSGLGQAAAIRDAIDARVGAARSANLTNFLTSLGNIGRENFALNQINSDRSRRYGEYRNGRSVHKSSSTEEKNSRWRKTNTKK